jgi:hypothetical protein
VGFLFVLGSLSLVWLCFVSSVFLCWFIPVGLSLLFICSLFISVCFCDVLVVFLCVVNLYFLVLRICFLIVFSFAGCFGWFFVLIVALFVSYSVLSVWLTHFLRLVACRFVFIGVVLCYVSWLVIFVSF